jgi:hypothetical protein
MLPLPALVPPTEANGHFLLAVYFPAALKNLVSILKGLCLVVCIQSAQKIETLTVKSSQNLVLDWCWRQPHPHA